MPRRAEIKTGKSGALHVATHEQFTNAFKAFPAMEIRTERFTPKGSQASGVREQGSLSQGCQETGCKDRSQRPQGGMGTSSGKLVSSIFQPELLRLPVRAGLPS